MVVGKAYCANQPITLRQACKSSSENPLSSVTGHTIEIWAMDLKQNDFFTVTKQGRKKIDLELNPFSKHSGDNDLY